MRPGVTMGLPGGVTVSLAGGCPERCQESLPRGPGQQMARHPWQCQPRGAEELLPPGAQPASLGPTALSSGTGDTTEAGWPHHGPESTTGPYSLIPRLPAHGEPCTQTKGSTRASQTASCPSIVRGPHAPAIPALRGTAPYIPSMPPSRRLPVTLRAATGDGVPSTRTALVPRASGGCPRLGERSETPTRFVLPPGANLETALGSF